MCGRYNVTDDPAVRYLMAKLGLPLYREDSLFNLQPTAFVPIVIVEKSETKVVMAVWWLLLQNSANGMRPNYKWKTFNAVAARADKSKLYAPALKRSRCILPASGYYEWKDRQAFHIAPESGAIAFAGLYRKWEVDGESLYSCSLMTTDGSPKLSHIHRKSLPVMLPESRYESWLSASEMSSGDLNEVFKPRIREPLTVYPVDSSVNKAETKGNICITPVGNVEHISADVN